MSDHQHMAYVAANIADFSFGLIGFIAYFGHLPDIAAGLTILWYIFRFIAWLRGKD